MNVYVGTSGYGYKKWKGRFYPEDLSTDKMLQYYSERFGAVEINNTFYRMPEASTLEAWTTEVPKAFRFALKAPQKITHVRRLRDSKEPLKQFLKAAAVLKGHLAPLLFQLPPNFKKDLPRLRHFISLLPKMQRITFEFRHASWFDDETFELLRKSGVPLCIAQDDNDLKVPFEATAEWGYLRLRRLDYTKPQLRAWAKRIQKQDWKDAFVFFKHEDTAKGPKFAEIFLELLK